MGLPSSSYSLLWTTFELQPDPDRRAKQETHTTNSSKLTTNSSLSCFTFRYLTKEMGKVNFLLVKLFELSKLQEEIIKISLKILRPKITTITINLLYF